MSPGSRRTNKGSSGDSCILSSSRGSNRDHREVTGFRVTRGKPYKVPAPGNRVQQKELEGPSHRGAEGGCDRIQVTMSPAPRNWMIQMLRPGPPQNPQKCPRERSQPASGHLPQEGIAISKNNSNTDNTWPISGHPCWPALPGWGSGAGGRGGIRKEGWRCSKETPTQQRSPLPSPMFWARIEALFGSRTKVLI